MNAPKAEMSVKEKMEGIVASYSGTYDYDLSLKMFNVTEEERREMEDDRFFLLRLNTLEQQCKASIIKKLIDMSDNAKLESVRLNAIIELGKILYREKFVPKDKESNGDTTVKVEVYMPNNGRDSE